VKGKLSFKMTFFCDLYKATVTICIAVLQECLELFHWLRNNWQIPFLLFASAVVPDKKMEFIVKRKCH
jgi:hypothetical protein